MKFTIPNEDERKEIWEKSFPEDAVIDGIPEQVKKYELTGGNIINVIHFAGIQAVEKRQNLYGENSETGSQNIIDPTHTNETGRNKLKLYLEDVLEGIRREYIKEGKPFGTIA